MKTGIIFFLIITPVILHGISDQAKADPPDSLLVKVSAEKLEDGRISLNSVPHRLYEGHTEKAYRPDFDDSEWEVNDRMWFSALDIPDTWTGERWYRVYLDVTDDLRGKAVALELMLVGAAEIWLNGDHLATYGNLTSDRHDFEYANRQNWLTAHFSEDRLQVLTFRFVNPRVDRFGQTLPAIQFFPDISGIEHSHNKIVEQERIEASRQWFFTGVFLVFAITHFLIFLYNPRAVFNLWFALSCLLFAFITLVIMGFFEFVNPETRNLLQRLMQSSLLLVFAFMSMFLYSALGIEPTRKFYILFFAGILLAVIHVLWFIPALAMVFPFAAVMIYVSWRGFRLNQEGAVILGAGTLLFVLSILAVLILEQVGHHPGEGIITLAHIPFVSFSVALVAMSLFQSRNLAGLNRKLRERLYEVRTLSDKNLKQERSLREAEVERVRLQTENERKEAELEKARELQLSLLPRSIPNSGAYHVKARMLTANEVGGDYYDFITLGDHHQVWALGDATGHGTDAGLVVAMTKTLFQSIVPHHDLITSLQKMSAELKKTGLRKRFMCLGLLEVRGCHLSWCSAGIPPLFIIRKNSGKVEMLESKGMPLGTVPDFSYTIRQSTFEPGDLLFLFSDGLLEQRDEEQEQFDLKRVIQLLEKNSVSSPDDVLDLLSQSVRNWQGTTRQLDDITMVCLQQQNSTSP